MVSVEKCVNGDLKNNPDYEKCFFALFKGKQIHLNLEALLVMLKQELHFNIDLLDKKLATVLPYMLAFYIKNWPGWQIKEYQDSVQNFLDLFEKFMQYIIDKLNYLINDGYYDAIKMLSKDKPQSELLEHLKMRTKCCQTESLMKKDIAPFTISITCPPKLMGTLIFADCGDDLLIRSHSEIPWKNISEKELLNWPHVSVQFVSPELSFKRNNCGEHIRFVHFNNCFIPSPKDNDFIEQIDIVDPTLMRKCYTLNMLRAYVKEYVTLLKHAKQIKELNIIELLLEEFLTDIEDIGMNNTMATNTSVLFNIGKSVFIRNKTASKKSTTVSSAESKLEIRYNEFFIPKMETTLFSFNAVQDMSTTDISFSYLNIYKAKKDNPLALDDVLPTLSFSCEFCNEMFNDSVSIMEHFESIHKTELSYICRFCKRGCSISQLSASRWKHSCQDR